MKKGSIFIDVNKCLSCRSCELACAVAHSSSGELEKALKSKEPLETRISVEPTEKTPKPCAASKYPAAMKISVPLQCRHCEDAPCVAICPTKALTKQTEPQTENIVLLDSSKCIGCKWCIAVCPFGVIKMNKKGTAVVKCDLCIERLRVGELPACVAACHTKALNFKTTYDFARDKRKKFLVEIQNVLEK
ncbi:MAG: 4Fe-4S dicluster domain-containing protein [Elusimicrobiota bacterium]